MDGLTSRAPQNNFSAVQPLFKSGMTWSGPTPPRLISGHLGQPRLEQRSHSTGNAVGYPNNGLIVWWRILYCCAEKSP